MGSRTRRQKSAGGSGMRKIFKYNLQVADETVLELPEGSDILHFDAQYDQPVLWALIDPEQKLHERRTFRMAGTGHVIDTKPRELSYIGTAQLSGGALVLHLFEIVHPKDQGMGTERA